MPQIQSTLRRWYESEVVRRAHPSPPSVAAPVNTHTLFSLEPDEFGGVGNDGGSGFVPALPVELWTAVARLAGRADVKELARTSRMFRDICLPVLFETVTIGWSGRMDGLLAIAQSDRLAGLVRTLNVARTTADTPRAETSTLLASCITQLSNLTLLYLRAGVIGPLLQNLQLAILTHPHLRTVYYDQWWDAGIDLRPAFARIRSHPLVIDKVTYAYPNDGYRTSPMDPFLRRMTAYFSHFGLRVRSFDLSLDARVGPVEPALTSLLSASLQGLEELRLSCETDDSYLDRLKSGDWLSRFLATNSAVTRVVIDFGGDLDDQGPISHIYLPLDGILQIAGLERTPSAALRSWCNMVPFAVVDIKLDRSAHSGDCSVVGLELTRLDCSDCDHDFELDPSIFGHLANTFPMLKVLRLKDFFGTGYLLVESLAPLALFTYLEHVTIPCDFLECGPDFCWHDAERLDELLGTARMSWMEEEQAAIADFKDGMLHECSPEELEAGRMFWECTSDDKDRDPDDETYYRLVASGLLLRRPTIRKYIVRSQHSWITIAQQMANLKTVSWDFYGGSWSPIGTIHWTVVRDVDPHGRQLVALFETSSDSCLDKPFCRCELIYTRELEEHLWCLPPLFEQNANFTPAFTLDRFVSRS